MHCPFFGVQFTGRQGAFVFVGRRGFYEGNALSAGLTPRPCGLWFAAQTTHGPWPCAIRALDGEGRVPRAGVGVPLPTGPTSRQSDSVESLESDVSNAKRCDGRINRRRGDWAAVHAFRVGRLW